MEFGFLIFENYGKRSLNKKSIISSAARARVFRGIRVRTDPKSVAICEKSFSESMYIQSGCWKMLPRQIFVLQLITERIMFFETSGSRDPLEGGRWSPRSHGGPKLLLFFGGIFFLPTTFFGTYSFY